MGFKQTPASHFRQTENDPKRTLQQNNNNNDFVGHNTDFFFFIWKPEIYLLQSAFATFTSKQFLIQFSLKWKMNIYYEF